MDIAPFILLALIWYAIGFHASHVILTTSRWLTWKNSRLIGVSMAIFGPVNYIGLFVTERKD